ncbi:MAG: VWA domain-containing protein [Silicimonas sp.]|nr:VWA domain-containing protein [Silicimonas sp.]
MRPAFILALCASLATSPGYAATNCQSDAMLVFDGSGSMDEMTMEMRGPTRIDEARHALRDALPGIAVSRRIGLLTYGAGADGACTPTLRFAPVDGAAPAVIAAIEGLVAGGLTPLTASVQAAAEVLAYRTRPATVVLVTDGNETCGGTPCATGRVMEAAGHDLTVHVIGFRVVVDDFTWDNPEQADYAGGTTVAKCLADATGGLFVTTETVDDLVEALFVTLGCPVIGMAPASPVSAATKNAPGFARGAFSSAWGPDLLRLAKIFGPAGHRLSGAEPVSDGL